MKDKADQDATEIMKGDDDEVESEATIVPRATALLKHGRGDYTPPAGTVRVRPDTIKRPGIVGSAKANDEPGAGYPLSKEPGNAPTTAEAPTTRPSSCNYRGYFGQGATANAKKFSDSMQAWEHAPTVQEVEASDDAKRDMDFLMELAYDLGADPVTVSEMYSPLG